MGSAYFDVPSWSKNVIVEWIFEYSYWFIRIDMSVWHCGIFLNRIMDNAKIMKMYANSKTYIFSLFEEGGGGW